MDVFKKNGYKRHQGIKAFKKVENPMNKHHRDDYTGTVHLPYIRGTTDKISHILRKNNIKTTFKPLKTINRCLKSVKDLIDPKHHKGVYLVPCSCGKTYIGETSQSITAPKPQPWLSTLVKPIITFASKTPMLWPKLSITTIKFKEAIEIRKHPDNLNRDDGWKISDNWIPMITDDSATS